MAFVVPQRMIAGAGLILFLILVAGCISQRSVAPDLTTVKVAYQPTSSNGPLYIAQEEGFFARQGIDMELVKTESTFASIPLLVSGDIAVTGGPASIAFMNAADGGAHIRLVADKGRVKPEECTPYALMVRRDLYDAGTIRNVSGLKGKKVVSIADKDYDLSRAIALGNLTYDDIDIVVMDFPSTVMAFQNGAADAGILSEPYITQAVAGGSAVVLVPAEEFIPGWGLSLFYGPEILDKDPELGKQFMVAYLQGVRQYNEGKTARNIAVISSYTGLDPDLVNQSCWYPIADDGMVSEAPLRDYIEWMYMNGKISRRMEADRLLDMSYVISANSMAGNTSPAAP